MEVVLNAESAVCINSIPKEGPCKARVKDKIIANHAL